MGKIDFIREFRDRAGQLNTHAIAGRWARLRDEIPAITAAEAAGWADLGYLPEEAADQIRSGITAAAAAEMEAHAEQEAGGPEALAAMRVAELLGSGTLLGPDDVVTVQDPDGGELIVPRDEL